MKQILTDEEIDQVCELIPNKDYGYMSFARAIEQSILEKIGEPITKIISCDIDGHTIVCPLMKPLYAIPFLEG